MANHNLNETLRQLVKKKGVGASMGKHLNDEELSSLKDIFHSEQANLTTKATLLTAILNLDTTKDEKAWIDAVKKNPSKFLYTKLIDFLPESEIKYHKNKKEIDFLTTIKKVISGQNLNKKEFKNNFEFCFDETIPDYLKAAFLEAQRLKRETFDENLACLEFLWKKCPRKTINTPILIDIANSYDGFDRNPHTSIFTAALLGSLGFPTLVHGIEEVAPKNGITAYKVIDAFGRDPRKHIDMICNDLQNPEIGWSYIDQSDYFPELYRLKQLRTDMVKRPILATMEKLLQPIRAKKGNHLITGYTHPAYKNMLSIVLQKHNKSPISLLARGLEGSAQLPLDRQAPLITITKEKIDDDFIRPTDFKIPERGFKKSEKEFSATTCVESGLDALVNTSTAYRNIIAYNAAAILWKFNLMEKKKIIPAIQKNLTNLKALDHFEGA